MKWSHLVTKLQLGGEWQNSEARLTVMLAHKLYRCFTGLHSDPEYLWTVPFLSGLASLSVNLSPFLTVCVCVCVLGGKLSVCMYVCMCVFVCLSAAFRIILSHSAHQAGCIYWSYRVKQSALGDNCLYTHTHTHTHADTQTDPYQAESERESICLSLSTPYSNEWIHNRVKIDRVFGCRDHVTCICKSSRWWCSNCNYNIFVFIK